jgi:hypothetical protein
MWFQEHSRYYHNDLNRHVRQFVGDGLVQH